MFHASDELSQELQYSQSIVPETASLGKNESINVGDEVLTEQDLNSLRPNVWCNDKVCHQLKYTYM